MTSGEATLTFAPGSLPSDAYVSITPETVSVPGLGSEVAYDLQAIDVSSGAKIETFNSPPVLSVVGSVPGSRIYYLDPVNGLQPISSSYNPATGAVTAGLPHFSTYLAGVSGILSTISGYLAQYASGAISQSQTFNVGSQSIGGVVEIDGVSLAFSGITFSGTSPNFTYSGTVTITAGGGSIAASPFTASFGSATGTYSLTNQAATAGTLTITVNAPSIAIANFVAISATAIKVVSSDDGTTSQINLGATGVTASLSAGAGGPSLSVNAANLGFVVRHGDSESSAPTFALKGTGSVSLTGLSQVALTGPAWEVAYDSMGDLSGNNAITVDAGSGTTVTVDLSQPTGVNGAWSSFANTPASLAQLTVGGQNLSGVFAVSESASQLTAAASDVGLQIGPAASPYVSIPNSASTPSGTGASGELIIAANGLAGDLTVPSIAINVPTLALASATGQIEINTQPAPVSQTFMVGGSSSTLALPAGPFVGVNVDVTNVTVGSGNASGQITGSLSFQQQTANGVTTSIVGISNATVAIGGSNVLTNGQGVLVVESTGVAGYLSGTASIAAGGVSAGGQVALRINTTGGAVNATVTVGGQTLTINYGAGEGNVFSVSIDGLSVNIAGIATLEGNVNLQSFTTTTTDGAIAGTAFAGSGMTVFVGNGPALLADGSPNPLAEGLEISGATVALFESGGNIAFVATGSVQLVGVPGATLGGQVSVRVNSFKQGFTETVLLPGGGSVPLDFAPGEIGNGTTAFSSAGGTGLTLGVGGQMLTTDVTLTSQSTGLMINLTNTSFSLASGSGSVSSRGPPIAQLTQGSGSLTLTSAGLFGTVSGTVAVNVPGATFAGTLSLFVNTTATEHTVGPSGSTTDLPAGPYLELTGSNVTVTIGGQSLSGSFSLQAGGVGAAASRRSPHPGCR